MSNFNVGLTKKDIKTQMQPHFKKLLKTSFLFKEFYDCDLFTDIVMSAVLSFVSGH